MAGRGAGQDREPRFGVLLTQGTLYSTGLQLANVSVGLIVGSLYWRYVNRTLGAREMLVISALLGSTAALLCVAIEFR